MAMEEKKISHSGFLVLGAVAAILVGNYLATVFTIWFSMVRVGVQFDTGGLLLANLRPLSEWTGGFQYTLVLPLMFVAVIAARLVWSRVSWWMLAMLLTVAFWTYIFVWDIARIRNQTGIDTSMMLIQMASRLVRVGVPIFLGLLAGEVAKRYAAQLGIGERATSEWA